MANKNVKNNKKDKLNDKKQTEAQKIKEKNEALLKEKEEKERKAKERKEKEEALKEAKLQVVKNYKYAITIIAALVFVFIAGIAYNAYSTMGHLFDDEVEYFYDIEKDTHAFNGRYLRLKVDAVMGWYEGIEVDENDNAVITGDTAKCVLWLDGDSLLSLTVGKEDFDKVNEVFKATSFGGTSVTTDKSIYLEGYFENLEGKELELYDKAIDGVMIQLFADRDDYYIYNYTLNTAKNKINVKVTTIVFIILASIFFIAEIIVCIKYSKYKKINGIKIKIER